MNSNPKAVLITGANARIGLELAKESLVLGYQAIIHFRSSSEPAMSIFKDDQRVRFLQGELTDNPERFIASALQMPLKIEGLINNASVFNEGDLRNPEHLKRTLDVNLMVPVRLSSEFAKSVNKGWIINIIDAHIDQFNPKFQNYRISKKFLREMTRQQAHLFAPTIRVNGIAPGAILPAEHDSDERFKLLAKNIPLRKTGSVENIRQAYKFLVENDYVTGSIIEVAGGWQLV